jgi:hypothetical protein
LPLGGASTGAPVVTVSVVLTVSLLSSRPGRHLLGGGSRD